MAKPFGVGDVVGGRYRITYHVVTSADQDIVFQAHDEALGREVSVLLASRSNAKQVATSARELAVNDRASEVEVLDLGLADDRTYLISTLVDPNQLLDLVVPDVAPFVEPYFTDSLGSEIFGQSRRCSRRPSPTMPSTMPGSMRPRMPLPRVGAQTASYGRAASAP
ncbi:hypothetical protein [Nesterenkonia pannonica]|uniref:hypothetical protein n=1 Tax=Nesterenkonia pannonica TaxID=1548602 RepID=UPI0021640B11|nr:hypothetical protein [Nesterenkonia pannonica]